MGTATPAGVRRDEVREVPEASPDQVRYMATGIIEDSRDWETFVNNESQHAGCELVLAANGLRLQVTIDGHARDWPEGMQVTTTGRFEAIGEYEWESFLLVETRSSWLVRDVRPVSNGDLVIDLVQGAAQ